jgi:hypothetical protein
MFKKIFEWFTRPQMSDLEYYIASKNPQNTADVEQLLKEFNYKGR